MTQCTATIADQKGRPVQCDEQAAFILQDKQNRRDVRPACQSHADATVAEWPLFVTAFPIGYRHGGVNPAMPPRDERSDRDISRFVGDHR